MERSDACPVCDKVCPNWNFHIFCDSMKEFFVICSILRWLCFSYTAGNDFQPAYCLAAIRKLSSNSFAVWNGVLAEVTNPLGFSVLSLSVKWQPRIGCSLVIFCFWVMPISWDGFFVHTLHWNLEKKNEKRKKVNIDMHDSIPKVHYPFLMDSWLVFWSGWHKQYSFARVGL